ncbi:MAG: stage II sporulation protein D [Oscillospiraceae bacterium]|nr:stage II sporulation protein D [Oscillospiraceae bacterium]
MKIFIAIALLASILSFIVPAVVYGSKTAAGETAQQESPQYSGEEVTVLDGEQTLTMDMEDYLVGVVAGEMPAEFETQALMAQAVAARTYTLYKMYVEPSENHTQTVCTDPTCCKAYAHEQELRDRWGADYEDNYSKISDAVSSTEGQYLTYDGQPILAVFHSSSPGRTEDSGDVWQTSLPYLKSVETPEGAEDVTNFVSEVRVLRSDFIDTVKERHPQAEFSQEGKDWITGYTYTPSGRVDSVNVGGEVISGKELREMFSLRSTAFSAEVTDSDVVFKTTGYGHGVGMSQYGANTLAKQGQTYEQILSRYYEGTAIEKIDANEP